VRIDVVIDLDNSLAIVEAVKAGDVLLQRSFPRDRQARHSACLRNVFRWTVELTLDLCVRWPISWDRRTSGQTGKALYVLQFELNVAGQRLNDNKKEGNNGIPQRDRP
jgi:hypothetical protein